MHSLPATPALAAPEPIPQPQTDTPALTGPDLAGLPTTFIPNIGQTDSMIRFTTRAFGGVTLFMSNEVALLIPPPEYETMRRSPPHRGRDGGWRKQLAGALRGPPTLLQVSFVGANPTPNLIGVDALQGKMNYLIGSDPSQWRTDIPTFASVVYQQLYPGIDLRYDGTNGALKSTYTIAPGVGPAQLRWQYTGAKRVRVDAAGNLVIELAAPRGRPTEPRSLIEQAPVAWQDINGQRVPVAAAFVVAADNSIGFTLGQYDPAYALTIDPTLSFSSYLGGSGEDVAEAVATDGAGGMYVTGYTLSPNFPIPSSFDNARLFTDGFVAKYQNNTQVYGAYFGGSGFDIGTDIAVSGTTQVYVTGYTTSSTQFPLANAADSTYDGGPDSGNDVFVIKLDLSQSGAAQLRYGTYLGANGEDAAFGIALSGSKAYVVGFTSSGSAGTNPFPTKGAFYNTYRGGASDVFVARINPAGSGSGSLEYSTYFGGSGDDQGSSIAVDSSGKVYITGATKTSSGFPLKTAYDSTFGGGSFYDAFVTKLDPAVTTSATLMYSTYLGGSNEDRAESIAIDGSNRTYVTGNTSSSSIGVKNAHDSSYNGSGDAFVTKLDPAATTGPNTVIYHTYLGGSLGEFGRGIAVDSGGNPYVTGWTSSSNFPTASVFQTFRGVSDAFITTFNTTGKVLRYSTFLGGSDSDYGMDIAVDSAFNAYVTGYTISSDFLTSNPQQATRAGNSDSFVARLALAPPATTTYYISSLDSTAMRNLGCARGQQDTNQAGTQYSIVVLAFGQPWDELVAGQVTYGSILFDGALSFASVTDIAAAAQQFGRGYFECTTSDQSSSLILAIGTSNFGSKVTTAHAGAWAQMVNNVQTWLSSNGYAPQVSAAGASDMELGWNTPAVTRAWVDSYDLGSNRLLYNFGDAEGCPQTGNGSTNQTCNVNGVTGWTQDAIWYISWGAFIARPLPQIYATSGANAKQWYQISLYASVSKGNSMRFAGTLTQRQACDQNPGASECVNANNTPEQGWKLLLDALNADSRTAQDLPWATDIRFQ
jgi:hypothetical protein